MTSAASIPTVVPADLSGRFTGDRVIVEPLAAEHADGLIAAATEPAMFRWMPVDMASSTDALHEWLATTLANARAGREVPFALLAADTGEVLGSTRFCSLALEHLRAEIGWTWVTPGRWSSGVNIETVVGDGGVRDSASYAIVDDDWPTVKAHLRARLEAKR